MACRRSAGASASPRWRRRSQAARGRWAHTARARLQQVRFQARPAALAPSITRRAATWAAAAPQQRGAPLLRPQRARRRLLETQRCTRCTLRRAPARACPGPPHNPRNDMHTRAAGWMQMIAFVEIIHAATGEARRLLLNRAAPSSCLLQRRSTVMSRTSTAASPALKADCKHAPAPRTSSPRAQQRAQHLYAVAGALQRPFPHRAGDPGGGCRHPAQQQ